MGIEQRKHIRFSLDIPAIRYTKYGERQEILLRQISIGGCLLDWDENIFAGDEFRLLIQLPNKNWLPLHCKALYKFEGDGIGLKFLDITRFEQELISKIISGSLAAEGLPLQVDPFQQPSKVFNPHSNPRLTDTRQQKDEILEKILSGGNVT